MRDCNVKEKYIVRNSLGMFDLFKGVMMIVVMVGHTHNIIPVIEECNYSVKEVFGRVNILVLVTFFLFKIVAEAAMPAFFIICGYGFRKTTNIKCILKQSKTILIPYSISLIATIVIHFLSYPFMYSDIDYANERSLSIILGGLLGVPDNVYINDLWIGSCGPIWFLLAMLIGTCIFNLLSNRFNDKKLFVASFLVSCLGWRMSFAGPLPWSVSQGLIAVLYIWLGHYAKKNKILVTPVKMNIVTGTICLGFGLYLIFVTTNSAFVMAYNMYPLGMVSIVANGLIGLIIIRLFLQLGRLKGKISLFIRKIGRLSLYVLCFHSIEFLAFGGTLQYLFVTQWWKGGLLLRNLIIIGVRVTVVLAVTFIFEKVRLSIKKK